jgi:hypothetical protein
MIKSIQEAMNAEKNPYANNGFFLDGNGNIYVLDDLPNDDEWYEDANLIYAIHWEGDSLYSEGGVEIEAAYQD